MKQKIDLVAIDVDGEKTYYTLRFHPAKRSFLDDMFFVKQPQINEGERIFVNNRRRTFETLDGQRVTGKIKQALIAFQNTLLFNSEFDEYAYGIKPLPEKSLYIWTNKLSEGAYGAIFGIFAYPEFKDAPEHLLP